MHDHTFNASIPNTLTVPEETALLSLRKMVGLDTRQQANPKLPSFNSVFGNTARLLFGSSGSNHRTLENEAGIYNEYQRLISINNEEVYISYPTENDPKEQMPPRYQDGCHSTWMHRDVIPSDIPASNIASIKNNEPLTLKSILLQSYAVNWLMDSTRVSAAFSLVIPTKFDNFSPAPAPINSEGYCSPYIWTSAESWARPSMIVPVFSNHLLQAASVPISQYTSRQNTLDIMNQTSEKPKHQFDLIELSDNDITSVLSTTFNTTSTTNSSDDIYLTLFIMDYLLQDLDDAELRETCFEGIVEFSKPNYLTDVYHIQQIGDLSNSIKLVEFLPCSTPVRKPQENAQSTATQPSVTAMKSLLKHNVRQQANPYSLLKTTKCNSDTNKSLNVPVTCETPPVAVAEVTKTNREQENEDLSPDNNKPPSRPNEVVMCSLDDVNKIVASTLMATKPLMHINRYSVKLRKVTHMHPTLHRASRSVSKYPNLYSLLKKPSAARNSSSASKSAKGTLWAPVSSPPHSKIPILRVRVYGKPNKAHFAKSNEAPRIRIKKWIRKYY